MMPFLFVWRMSSYCFIISAASSGFCTFSASSFKSSISTALLMVMDSITLLWTLCLLAVCRFSPQLKTKKSRYTKYLKHSSQTKMRLHWAQNTSFSTWLRVVKVLYHKHFRKIVFQIKLMSKTIFKKLN